MAIASRGEGGVGGGKGPGGYSYRSSELTLAEKRALKKQNRSAESMKNKDLDQFEKGRIARQRAKLAAEAELKAKLKAAETKGKIKGAAGTAGVGIAAIAVAKDKKKSAPAKSADAAKAAADAKALKGKKR